MRDGLRTIAIIVVAVLLAAAIAVQVLLLVGIAQSLFGSDLADPHGYLLIFGPIIVVLLIPLELRLGRVLRRLRKRRALAADRTPGQSGTSAPPGSGR